LDFTFETALVYVLLSALVYDLLSASVSVEISALEAAKSYS
jgi:hypothetical protein